jgi:hypothetical protein
MGDRASPAAYGSVNMEFDRFVHKLGNALRADPFRHFRLLYASVSPRGEERSGRLSQTGTCAHGALLVTKVLSCGHVLAPPHARVNTKEITLLRSSSSYKTKSVEEKGK